MKITIIIFSVLFTIVVKAQHPPTKFFNLCLVEENIALRENGEFVYGEVIKSSRSNDTLFFKERLKNFNHHGVVIKDGKLNLMLYGNDPGDNDVRLLLFKFINKKKENVDLYLYYEPLLFFGVSVKSDSCLRENYINIFRHRIGFDFLNVEKGTYLIDMRSPSLQNLSQKILSNRKALLNQLERKIDEQNIPYVEAKIRYFYKNKFVKNNRDSLNYYRELYKSKTAIHDEWVQEILQNKDCYMGYFETEVQLRNFFEGVRNPKDYYNTKSAICTLIEEFDVTYVIKQKLVEELKISEKIVSLKDLEKHYKNNDFKKNGAVKELLSVFEGK